ncbi:MAG: fibronectin type III domain-containing protein [Verrucomicrobiota bacterium]
MANGRGYDVEIAEVEGETQIGPWQNRGFFSSFRAMVLTDLQRGKTYAIRVRALGGRTGHSDWSDAVTQTCM